MCPKFLKLLPLLALLALPAHAHEGGLGDGGGFVDENSAAFLTSTSQALAKKLRSASPDLLQLPKGWSQEKLAHMIETIRQEPTAMHPPRQGRMVMLDFGVDKKGPYITALAPYFLGYSQVPVKTATPEQLAPYRKDLSIKLIHEAAHLLGKNESEAEKFATDVLDSLDGDMYSCDIEQQPALASQNKYVFIKRLVINRPEEAYVSVEIDDDHIIPVFWTFAPGANKPGVQEFNIQKGAGQYADEDIIPDRVLLFTHKSGELSAEITFTPPGEAKQHVRFSCEKGYIPVTLPGG
ncbi:MAG: hypothetical protein ACXWQO_17225 [Bdellovibrionota bacterium]